MEPLLGWLIRDYSDSQDLSMKLKHIYQARQAKQRPRALVRAHAK